MIRIEGLNLSVGSFALKNVSLDVAPGEYFVLLGPSGSGKTLLLETLCGLRRADSGWIVIGDTDVTFLEPRQRDIGYVPQDYALFPHLSIRYNVGFGLSNPLLSLIGDHWSDVDRLMAMVGIAHLADRRPRWLSGGEKQRVALARALATRPRLLLLDEPVSALDEDTRDTLCRQLRQVQQATGTTTVHVCHNFAEMMTVADRVGVIHQGEIIQVGTPEEVLRRPRNTFVAKFVQAGNLLDAEVQPGGEWLRLVCNGGVEFRMHRQADVPERPTVRFVVRPESIRLEADRPADMPEGTTFLQGRVSHVTHLGPVVQVTVSCDDDLQLLASLGKREYDTGAWQVDHHVHVAVAPQDVHVLEE